MSTSKHTALYLRVSTGQSDVHADRRDGGVGIVVDLGAGHGGHGGGEGAGQARGASPHAAPLVKRIEGLAETTRMSVRQIRTELNGKVGRSVIGEIVKRVRDGQEVG